MRSTEARARRDGLGQPPPPPLMASASLRAGLDALNRRYAQKHTTLMWAAGHDASAGVDDVEATIKTLIDHGAALDLKDDPRQDGGPRIARGLGDERAAKSLER